MSSEHPSHFPRPEEVLPHRDPFLFIEEVQACTDTSATATYQFSDEHFFAGHFPGRPVVPGVILIEGLAQTLAYLALRLVGGGTVFLTGVDACKIRRMVRPGDRVTYRIEVLRTKLKMVVARGTVSVVGEKVLHAELRGIIEPNPSPDIGP